MNINSLECIKAIDKKDLMGRVIGLPQQVKETQTAMTHIDVPDEFSKCSSIVIVGMGGSGIPGDFIRNLYQNTCSVPVFVHKDYGLPAFVGENTLMFAVSYTGTTEETIDAFCEALRRKTKVFGISSGDKLLSLLKKNGIPHFAPPPGRTTRECLGYLLFTIVRVLEHLKYISNQSPSINETVMLLEKKSSTYSPEAESNNQAKEIASRLYNKVPLIYGSSDLTDVVALRWKHQINENSKVLVQIETFPDVTHNQLAVIENPRGIEKEIYTVLLRNKNEKSELSRRIEAVKELFSRKGIEFIEHWGEGKSLMASLLSQSYLGDFVSVYLAVLNGIDPTPTVGMSDLKKVLDLTDLTPQ